jgi:class 3 adenylate cyclase
MGLHTGVAQERQGDYFGPAVNRTARIAVQGMAGRSWSVRQREISLLIDSRTRWDQNSVT